LNQSTTFGDFWSADWGCSGGAGCAQKPVSASRMVLDEISSEIANGRSDLMEFIAAGSATEALAHHDKTLA
jgi:hypothetical protein